MPNHETDPTETQEWLDALDGVIDIEGADRAHYLLERVIEGARRKGAPVPYSANTPYLNTIPPEREERHPGDRAIEHRIRSFIRWNALAIVLRANKHSSPGIYARAFLEGRLTEDQLLNFRQEVDGKGISSYPHPWLMPTFWQFPTVSMGLGPLMAIYQARFLKYLHCRGLANTENRKVWAFLGDGETDEPESLGAIGLASREKLDNLVFVINCNLQRLDGPVRGNGKI